MEGFQQRRSLLGASLILLLLLSCGRGSQEAAGGGCGVEEKDDGTILVKCADGSSQVLRHGKDGQSCQLRDHPNKPGQAVQILCPSSPEWMTLRNGRDGEPGRDGASCQVRRVDNGGHILICDGRIISVISCEVTQDENGKPYLKCDPPGNLPNPL